MEYNPVAINEAMAYSFAISSGSGESNRFFVELVNTLSQSAHRAAAGRRLWCRHHQSTGCLDSRPVAGQLRPGDDRRRPGQPPRPVHRPAPAHLSAKYYAQLPLNQANSAATNPLFTASQSPATCSLRRFTRSGAATTRPRQPTSDQPDRYFFVIGSPLASGTETAPINATAIPVSGLRPPLRPRRRRRPPPSNVVPPGYCLNLQSVPVTPQPVTTKSNTMPPKITPLAVRLGHDAVLLALPAAASQSVRAAPGRHQSVDV